MTTTSELEAVHIAKLEDRIAHFRAILPPDVFAEAERGLRKNAALARAQPDNPAGAVKPERRNKCLAH